MTHFDVVAIGNANIDLVFKVPRLPQNDGKVVGKKILEAVGGTVANCACVMGRLGLKTASLSAAGDDYYGRTIVMDFQRFNVSTEFVDIVPGLDANMAVIFLDDSAEKALIYAPGEEPAVSKTRYREALSHCKTVYTMPGNVDEFETFAAIAHQHQAQVVVDIEPHIADTPEKLARILSMADVAIFNLEGFLTCVGQTPDKAHLTALRQRYDLHTLVVTRGAQGAIAVNQWECAEHPGYSVPVVDTTGAGDTFNGALVYCLMNHYALQDALTFACGCSAISIGYLGARGNIPSVDGVRHFIQRYQPVLKNN